MTKKKDSKKDSPFIAAISIISISLFTSIIVNKFGPKNNNNNNNNIRYQQPSVQTPPHHANVIGQPIIQKRENTPLVPGASPIQQQGYVGTISENTPVNNVRIIGHPISVQSTEQQQQQIVHPQAIPMTNHSNLEQFVHRPIIVPPKEENNLQPPISGNGYRGLISSHAFNQIRDSNSPIVASSKIMSGPKDRQLGDSIENNDSGDYPYPSEVLTPEAIMSQGQQE